MELPTRKYVDLSTAHISRKDSQLLVSPIGCVPAGLIVYENEYGFFIPITNEESPDMTLHGFSREFAELVTLCQEQGISLIRLDCDAPKIEGLPEFDW
jgi:hypothetical protein